eukprot:jgi/Hompol1/4353/HPOL_007061-RA
MRQKNLVSSNEYGIAPYTRALENLETNANKLYGPVLGRRSNGERIRIALGILEGWKFFFNLPSSLTELIKKARPHYSFIALKGKYLMQSSFGSDVQTKDQLHVDTLKPKDSSALLPKNHKEVFTKVWAEVERIVAKLREDLFSKLGDPSQSLDMQEKII